MNWFDVDVTKDAQSHVVRIFAESRAVATRTVRLWGKGRKVTGVRTTPAHVARKLNSMRPKPEEHLAFVDGKPLRPPWTWR